MKMCYGDVSRVVKASLDPRRPKVKVLARDILHFHIHLHLHIHIRLHLQPLYLHFHFNFYPFTLS